MHCVSTEHHRAPAEAGVPCVAHRLCFSESRISGENSLGEEEEERDEEERVWYMATNAKRLASSINVVASPAFRKEPPTTAFRCNTIAASVRRTKHALPVDAVRRAPSSSQMDGISMFDCHTWQKDGGVWISAREINESERKNVRSLAYVQFSDVFGRISASPLSFPPVLSILHVGPTKLRCEGEAHRVLQNCDDEAGFPELCTER